MTAITLVGLGSVGVVGYLNQPAPIVYSVPTTVGAGNPLPEATDIQVLTPTEITLPEPSTSGTQVTVLEAQPSHTFPVEDPKPPAVNLVPLQVGTNLGLLQTAIVQGSPQAALLAQTTLVMAQPLGNASLTQALTALTQNLPPQGAPTLAILTTLASTAIASQPQPTIAPNPNVAPAWLAPIITIRRISTLVTPTNPATPALTNLMNQLAAGQTETAAITLTQPPLNDDPTLTTLRTTLTSYISIQKTLAQTLQAYQTLVMEPTP